MNISGLHKDLIIKNYKELCGILGVEVKKGKGRDLQIEDWKRYFCFERDGHKYIITKIYDESLTKENKKSNGGILSRISQGKYSREMFPLVKNFVAKNDIEYISKGVMMRKLKLKNGNYDVAMNNPEATAEYLTDKLNLEISKEDVSIILHSIYDNATTKIHNAFTNLEKLKYIYSYTDRLLTVFDRSRGEYIPDDEITCKIENMMMVEKATILQEYFKEIDKLDYFNDMLVALREECEDDFDKMSRKLTSQLFFRGLLNELKDRVLNSIAEDEDTVGINNYYYSYGYIKNEDMEWEKEILDVAKENLHINNYKEIVKSSFLSKSFVNDFKSKLYVKEKNKYKRDKFLEDNLMNHLLRFGEKSDILFDLFTSDKPQIILKQKEINDYLKDKKSHLAENNI